MKLKETLEIFEIEEAMGGEFRIIKQPSIDFRTFKSSCGWYVKTCAYPEFYTDDNIIIIYLRGAIKSNDLRWFGVPVQYIQNFKQSIKEFCKEMKWKLIVNNEYIGII